MTLDLPAVTAALTTVPALPDGDTAALAAAVRTQADRQAIQDLCALYARAVDDHDIDALVAMYAADGVFERRGVPAAGSDAIRAAYVASFDSYRTMLHTPHPGVVALHGDGTASGWSHGHAELATRSTLVLASYRYEDAYRCAEGRWRFARRSITFMYAVPADRLATSFGGTDRIRWPRTSPEPADYPETAPTWDSYHR
ncbi:nuclear transport factor 2 family protein [Pseudonocardia adelaidensis]|uniref:SnoaL-like domain-containing protein n=1 Tax=Pseudonocardia adelaidensis TaxID=648754 RepID=A0ABP9NWM7_9PSEU